jgi:hypothetical protein
VVVGLQLLSIKSPEALHVPARDDFEIGRRVGLASIACSGSVV